MPEIRALTVQPPWSWAIAHGGKLIENRTRGMSYRGLLAIHSGARWSDRGATDPRVLNAWTAWLSGRDTSTLTPEHLRDFWEASDTLDPDDQRERELIPRGGIVAVADLVDSHPDGECCRPWGESAYDEHGGRRRISIHHLVLENIRPLAEPIPCKGALGLWRPPADVAEAALAQTTGVAQ
jgi:hypothetical protein